MGTVTDDLYEALGHFARKDVSGDLRKFTDAIGMPLERLHEIVANQEDGKPGWSGLFDVDKVDAEHLAYVAQFPGARLTPEMSIEQQRAEIKEPSSWKRGTTEALRTSIQRTLTGSKRVIIRERTPEPWSIYVRVLLEEAPDPARSEAVARQSKLVGLVMDFAAIDAVTLADLEAGWDPLEELEGAFATVAELEAILPTELPEP